MKKLSYFGLLSIPMCLGQHVSAQTAEQAKSASQQKPNIIFILADDMGLGKTVQVLSYLLAMKQNGQTLPSLIVCPASLVLNWAEECRKFTPELNCVVVDGDAAHRAQLAEQWDGADVVVTSYDLLRRDETLYESQKFYACILDEAQASTPAQQWLMAHCWEYGFILRYPAEKQDITGIIYEPWHYRYVGRDHAQAIRQSGQCLEEFLQAEHP